MTDTDATAPPADQAPAASSTPPAPPAAAPDPPDPPARTGHPMTAGERVGAVLMAAAVVAIAVLVADVAMKGRLLAPLFARLPAPKAAADTPPAEQTEDADATPRPGTD